MFDNDAPTPTGPDSPPAPPATNDPQAPPITALGAAPMPSSDQLPPSNPARPDFKPGSLRRLAAFAEAIGGRGGLPGAVEAAVDPRQFAREQTAKNELLDSNVRFQNARAAAAVAQAASDQFNLEHLPEQLQDQHERTALSTINTLKNIFPVAASTDHTTTSAVATLKNLAADNPSGQIPHTINVTLPSTGQTISFSTEKASVDPEAFNKAREAAGLPALDPAVVRSLKPEKLAEMLDNAYSLWTSVPGDAKGAESLYAQIQNAKNAYAQRTPEWDSNKKGMLAKFDQRLSDVQSTLNFYDARERQHAYNKYVAHRNASDIVHSSPSPLGDETDLDPKQYHSTMLRFKPDSDALAKTEQSYQMFQNAAADARKALAGQGDMTGAQSVTTLFNAIGLSATPLRGMGFRINNNTVAEHANARGLGESLYQRLLSLKSGDLITPQQILDYSNIAAQARRSAYQTTLDKAQSYGLKRDFMLPRGHGRQLDPNTRDIFLDASDGDAGKAAKVAQTFGWRF